MFSTIFDLKRSEVVMILLCNNFIFVQTSTSHIVLFSQRVQLQQFYHFY